MIKKSIIFLVTVSIFLLGHAQVKVGEWKDHLSYNDCNTVAKAGNFVYCSNRTGIIKFNISDNTFERLNKINGLSDIGISLIRYNNYNNTLLIVYDNANIDVIKDNTIINFPDIKLKIITGKKNINEVTFKNNLAYLACGFGIVIFDTDKLEIKDSYIIGPAASYLNVYQVEYTDTTIFAATTIGLLKANLSTLLNNYQNWKLVPNIPVGVYNAVAKYNNKIVANYSQNITFGVPLQDTLYSYSGVSWAKELIKPFPYTVNKLVPNPNFLSVIDQFGCDVFNSSQARVAYITQYTFGYAGVNDVSPDFSNPIYPIYWIADYKQGFVQSYGQLPFSSSKISINGTRTNYVGNISATNGKIISAPVKVLETGNGQYLKVGLSYYDGMDWSYIKEDVYDTIFDQNFAIIDKKDPNHVWASSWFQGLLEYKNKQLTKVYNSINCVIPSLQGWATAHRVAGLSMDESGNLWIGSSDVSNFLSVRKANGTFVNIDFSAGLNGVKPAVGKVFADKNNQVWVLFPRGNGIAVVKNNNFINFPVTYLSVSNGAGQTINYGAGKLPDPYVNAIAEDLDGHIWIGTHKGLGVFYNPANITSGAGNFDCQQILITQDGHVQILLETEVITAITVDGANRKWVGTESSGIFCFSPDGQTQIFHFTLDDSPLFSNNIIDLSYDEVDGDIYIGTDRGIQSYRTSIIKGEDEFTEVHAYPNPVRPGYTGSVYVRGLISGSIVKITDVSGNLVWEGKSQGGQIEWPVKNLSGQKASSGVYLAYCSTSDGVKSAVTKILVIN